MSVLTIRGRDSAEAMELVVAKLGSDAMILSTMAKDGFVEIKATSELEADAEPLAKPTPSMAASRPETGVSGEADFASHLPQFMQTRKITVAPVPVSRATREQVMDARRIVLVGPIGAGKSHVALQLASERIDTTPDSIPSFAFIGSGSHCDGAYMKQKAWLLGEEVDFADGGPRPLPAEGGVEIAVVSARSDNAKSYACSLGMVEQSLAVLVVPAGLRADLVEALATQWRGIAKGVILTAGPGIPVVDADVEAVEKTGLPLLWTAQRDRLVSGLSKGAGMPAPSENEPVLEETGERI